jgi:hypothetical protein
MALGTGLPCDVTAPETFAILGCQQPTAARRMTTQAATSEIVLA